MMAGCAIIAFFMLAHNAVCADVRTVDASELGFSPNASPGENARILQKAVVGGHRRVVIAKAGVYRLSGPVWLDDETELSCATGVVFRKAADYARILINRGAKTGAANVNITITGLLSRLIENVKV